MNKLGIIGPYPPQYGGVSVHLERLRNLLVDKNIPFIIYNSGSYSEESDGTVIAIAKHRYLWMFKYIFFGKESSVYIHSPKIFAFIFGFILSTIKNRKVIICVHNSRSIDKIINRSFGKFILKTLFSSAFGLVCVNTHIVDILKSIDIDHKRIHHFPAFLPPPITENWEELLPNSVLEFSKKKFPIVSANGRIALHNNTDLYGMDLIFTLAGKLKDYPTIGFIIYFWDFDKQDKAYLKILFNIAERFGVSDRILVIKDTNIFYPVLKLSHLFLRPTNTDGDSVSIREAMFFKVPVIASDVVERPIGVNLFKNRDIEDLEIVVRKELNKLEPDYLSRKTYSNPNPSLETSTDRYLNFLKSTI